MKEVGPAWVNSGPVANPGDDVADSRVRLILVDDDDDFREAASAELMDLGFEVTSFSDGAEMLGSIAEGNLSADVIVLDWGLPSLAGIDLLPRLRREGIQLPVVFLTGRTSLSHENLAFDRGALDFVDKSRGVPILAKRLRLIVESSKRPRELTVDETLHCGRLMLKPRVSRAYWDDVDVNLTLTEFNIVRLLASNIGNHVTYRAVYDCMHHVGFIAGSGEHGYRTNVRSSIKRIRNKFRLIDPNFDAIENYPSFGYRWGSSTGSAA
ncbi:two-component system, OmpR family, response regulator ChvI [Enhydrobacter aerosaccus]|uniref:Two-component system, OmpR family, response regulator ChvI n=2 Tax=Enhydrobacter aerosaccus TaxID=225324 RepID=A0A1T4SRF4_9HYPH|nr:two-component system, OmpR family, response regulator ChvI [Enhydrobacter aerosaccus]